MKSYTLFLCVMLAVVPALAQDANSFNLGSFDKVIVSPYVKANLVQGTSEAITVDHVVSMEKLNFEIKGNTLWVYLEDAKFVPKDEKVDQGGNKVYKAIYNKTMAEVTITYKKLNTLSVRGEEVIRLLNKLDQKDFTLRMYGDAKVFMPEIQLEKLKVTMYGNSFMQAANGQVDYQKLTTYGNSNVNALDLVAKKAKIITYGDGDIKINVSNSMRISCYGDSHVTLKGTASIDHRLVLGSAKIIRIGSS